MALFRVIDAYSVVDRKNSSTKFGPTLVTAPRAGPVGRLPLMGEEFVRVINEGDPKLFQYPSVVRKAISTRSTHAEALREMIETNIEAIVVTDETNHLQGIAEREQILSRMMLALTEKK